MKQPPTKRKPPNQKREVPLPLVVTTPQRTKKKPTSGKRPTWMKRLVYRGVKWATPAKRKPKNGCSLSRTHHHCLSGEVFSGAGGLRGPAGQGWNLRPGIRQTRSTARHCNGLQHAGHGRHVHGQSTSLCGGNARYRGLDVDFRRQRRKRSARA